jgi:hypothetical protein
MDTAINTELRNHLLRLLQKIVTKSKILFQIVVILNYYVKI